MKQLAIILNPICELEVTITVLVSKIVLVDKCFNYKKPRGKRS
jgi:hypothetical protein